MNAKGEKSRSLQFSTGVWNKTFVSFLFCFILALFACVAKAWHAYYVILSTFECLVLFRVCYCSYCYYCQYFCFLRPLIRTIHYLGSQSTHDHGIFCFFYSRRSIKVRVVLSLRYVDER